MQIEEINNEDFEQLLFKRKGRKSIIFKKMVVMKIGDCICFDKTVLRSNNQLSRVLYYIRKNYHYEFSGGRLADGSGWAYKREK